MKHRYTAVILAAMLLLGASGCGSRPDTVPPTEPGAFTDALPDNETDYAPELSVSDGETVNGETMESTAAVDGTGDTAAADTAAAAPAAAATAPVQIGGNDAPQPATLMSTVDPALISTDVGNADDDQMGDYNPQTAPAVTHEDKPVATTPPSKSTEKTPVSKLATKGGASGGKLQISVQTVEITEAQLKVQDYTVDLLVTLDKNPGITYSEWGLQLDKRCTYTGDTDDLPIDTIFFINDSSHFLWSAWTSGEKVNTKTGGILRMHVKLPRDAKSGTSYPITYADASLQPAPHIWQSNDSNWVSSKEVGWTNGGIIVK